MERTIISFDWAIKNILRDKANFDVLSGFLSELLGRNVEVLEILESESNIESPLQKTNRVDLKAKINNDEIAVFEIQFFDQIDFMGKIVFNACKAVVEQVTIGKPYDISKVYSINIAYFSDFGAKKDYVFRAKLAEFAGVNFGETIPFTQNLTPQSLHKEIHPEYYLILPTKFDEQIRGKFDEWVYALKKSKIKSEFTAAGIQAASEKLDIMKMSEDEKKAYYEMQADIMDHKSQLYTAEIKGKEEGKLEVAKKLKAMGLPTAQIAEATGFSATEIENLD